MREQVRGSWYVNFKKPHPRLIILSANVLAKHSLNSYYKTLHSLWLKVPCEPLLCLGLCAALPPASLRDQVLHCVVWIETITSPCAPSPSAISCFAEHRAPSSSLFIPRCCCMTCRCCMVMYGSRPSPPCAPTCSLIYCAPHYCVPPPHSSPPRIALNRCFTAMCGSRP